MRRAVSGILMIASGLSFGTAAQASLVLSSEKPAVAVAPSGRADLLKLWVSVGRCVVQRDRTAALAFARAPIGSDDSLAAARRLDPVFVGCLAGSRVPGPSSVVLRRAAVAHALGLNDRA